MGLDDELWRWTATRVQTRDEMRAYIETALSWQAGGRRTDSLNERSRAALLRIGAREEGTLRNHMVTWTGRIRHSVYFSVIEGEWPAVKAQLERKLHSG